VSHADRAAVGVTTHMDHGNSVCAVRADDTMACWSYERER
jgi:hypothetical protein